MNIEQTEKPIRCATEGCSRLAAYFSFHADEPRHACLEHVGDTSDGTWVALETKVRLFPEGNQWAATFEDFVNLHESPAGFGSTPEEAVAGLMAAWKKAE